MSSSDLFVDGFPHGTPQGYDDGCRGGACPAGVEYGLSCKTAKAKSRGDYQYQQLAKRGATVPEIADALGFVGTETTTVVLPAKKAIKPKPTPATAKGARAIAYEPKPAPAGPEPVENAAPQTPEPPRMNGPQASSSTIATGNAPGSTPDQSTSKPTAPKTGEIRAWAIAKGYKVGAKGKLPQHIVDHYWDATGRLDVEPAPDTKQPEPVTIASESVTEDAQTVTGDAKPLEMDTDRPEPDISASGFISILVPADAVTDEQTAEARPARPEWGDVAESVDVEAARSIAVRLEQELAHVSEQLEHALTLLVARTAEAAGRRRQIVMLTDDLRAAERAAAAGEIATQLALRKWAKERADNEASYAVILDQAITINRLNRQIFENRLEHTIANLEDVFTADLLPKAETAPMAETQKTRRRVAWRNR